MWLLAKLMLALYLVASALARNEVTALTLPMTLARLAIAVALLARPEVIHLTALALAIAVMILHRRPRQPAAA